MARKEKRGASPSDTDLHERVAALETLVRPIPEQLSAIQKSLNRYQGAWGAVTLIFSAVGIFFTIFWGSIAKKLGWAS